MAVGAPGVLADDYDADGQALTSVLQSNPAGDLTFNPDGSFSYTPVQDYVGEDLFTYLATDGTSQSAVTTVTIFIGGTNDAPVANDDVYNYAVEDEELVVLLPGILGNDSDPEGEIGEAHEPETHLIPNVLRAALDPSMLSDMALVPAVFNARTTSSVSPTVALGASLLLTAMSIHAASPTPAAKKADAPAGSDNPLLVESTLPYKLPPLNKIENEHFVAGWDGHVHDLGPTDALGVPGEHSRLNALAAAGALVLSAGLVGLAGGRSSAGFFFFFGASMP